MISSLSTLDRQTAAGLLARTALAMDDERNPGARFLLPDEAEMRRSILEEISVKLGFRLANAQVDDIERLNEALDLELDALSDPIDLDHELEHLSELGTLPTDLYQLTIIPNVRNVYMPKWLDEYENIKATVHHFDMEQHFHKGENLHLISLFAKTFFDKYSNRNFLMLVAGQRDGLKLYIHQAWRLYSDRVNLDGFANLLDLFKRFSDEFGADVEVDGKIGKFFVLIEKPISDRHIRFLDKKGKPDSKAMGTMLSSFSTLDSAGKTVSALVIAVDIDKYRRALVAHGW